MDSNEFAGLSLQKRFKQMKIWPLLILFAIVVGVIGVRQAVKSVDPIVAQIYAKSATLHVLEKKLAETEKEISTYDNKEDIPEKLIKKQQFETDFIKKTKEELYQLYEEAKKQDIKFTPPDFSSIFKVVIGTVYAQETSNIDSNHINNSLIQSQKKFKNLVLKIILAIMAIAYLMVNYKVWFSSNPRNMNVAIDLLKTLTGFWVGLGTTAF